MPKGRPTNGTKIRELREDLGLSQAALAKMAGVDEKTIGRMEKGGPNLLFHLSCVAQVFQLTCKDLCMRRETGGASRQRSKRRVRITLIFDVDPSDFAAACEHVAQAEARFGAKHVVELQEVETGSIRARYRLAYGDLVRVLMKFCRKEFDDLRLTRIYLPIISRFRLQLAIAIIRFQFALEESHDRYKAATAESKDRIDSRFPDVREPIVDWIPVLRALLASRGFTRVGVPGIYDLLPQLVEMVIDSLERPAILEMVEVAARHYGISLPNIRIATSTKGAVKLTREASNPAFSPMLTEH
jgi:DNA-binding XRE family transcriptional regulator